ncbi:MAG: hypothetical protein LC749_17345, partial [Actinobacteria bacterium]|nr:hypothetical protein [Actinomycetota bacterium]
MSPSTVDRVLSRHGLALKAGIRPGRSHNKPWPDRTEWRPNQLVVLGRVAVGTLQGRNYAYAIVDLASRKWITTILVPEATSTQNRV